MSSQTFLRWPQEQHSWVNHSSSVGTPHLTSYLTDLLTKHETLSPFRLNSDCNTDKWNTSLLSLLLLILGYTQVKLNKARRSKVRGIHGGCSWYLYPPLPSATLSSEHKAHLIGWASFCQPSPQLNAEHQALCDVLTFSLSLSLFPSHSLSLHTRVCCLQPKHFSCCTPTTPSLSDDTGPHSFLPDMIWDLAVARGPLSTPQTLLRLSTFVCF